MEATFTIPTNIQQYADLHGGEYGVFLAYSHKYAPYQPRGVDRVIDWFNCGPEIVKKEDRAPEEFRDWVLSISPYRGRVFVPTTKAQECLWIICRIIGEKTQNTQEDIEFLNSYYSVKF